MAQNGFSVNLNAVLNTSDVQKQIKQLNLSTQKMTSVKLNFDGHDAIKTVKTLTDGVGTLYKQVQILESATGMQLKNSLTQVSTAVETVYTETNKWATATGKVITDVKKVSAEGNTIITRTREYTDELGRAVKEVQNYDEAYRPLGQNIKTVVNDQTKVAESAKEVGNNVSKASQAFEEQARLANKLNLSLADCLKRYIAFYAAQIPIRLVTTAISESLEVVKDYDKSITEMSKVWNDAYGSMGDTVDKLGQIGSEVARVKGEMVDIATGVVKAGFSDAVDIETISKVAAMLQNTADEALTADEATAILVSQLRAYHMEAENAIEITDILNAVSAQEAITSGGLAKGLQQASSALATYNNDIYETTALITGGTTVLQGRQTCP